MNDVYLRRNIATNNIDLDGVRQMNWIADELHFVTSMDAADIEPNFDRVWAEVEYEQMGYEERVTKLKAELLDTQDAMASFYEAVLGVE